MLSEAERDAVLVTAREAIPRDTRLHRGDGDQRDAARHPADEARGGDRRGRGDRDHPALLHQGLLGSAAAQVRHYLAVAEASPIPVLIYNFPVNTGINLEPDTVARIAEHPNVCGDQGLVGEHPAGGADHPSHAEELPRCSLARRRRSCPRSPSAPRAESSRWPPSRRASSARCYALAGQGRWEEAKEVAARMMLADRGVVGPLRHRRPQGRAGSAGPLWRAVPGAPGRRRTADAIEDIKEVLATAGSALSTRGDER